jgi:hypothetical protein
MNFLLKFGGGRKGCRPGERREKYLTEINNTKLSCKLKGYFGKVVNVHFSVSLSLGNEITAIQGRLRKRIGYTIRIPRSKTDQEGKGVEIVAGTNELTCPMLALESSVETH